MWTNSPPTYSEKAKLKLLKSAPLKKLIEYLLLPKERKKV